MGFVNIFNILYPIGSIYITTNTFSPSEIIGGTWSRVEDAVLRSGEEVGYVGEDTHTLTVNEMPTHTHHVKVAVNTTSHPSFSNVLAASGYVYTNNYNGTETSPMLSSNVYDGASPAGYGKAHSIVQRSYNCYIWQRIS